MKTSLLKAISAQIESVSGENPRLHAAQPVGGGCIHEAYMVEGTQHWFVKVNDASHQAMFEAEHEALAAIAATGAIRVPKPLAQGIHERQGFLVMEHLSFESGSTSSWWKLGRALAQLHRHTSPDGRFGWPHDNFIGATPQPNGWRGDWTTFWREQRLGFQFQLAAEKGMTFRGADELLAKLEKLIAAHQPSPSLLHGDLWSGNAGFITGGEPVVFDPACYFGDRECDLAFTRLFGGFPSEFYEAYENEWPLPSGWRERETLHNLYHVLNHWNLFGGGYRQQAQHMIDRLLTLV